MRTLESTLCTVRAHLVELETALEALLGLLQLAEVKVTHPHVVTSHVMLSAYSVQPSRRNAAHKQREDKGRGGGGLSKVVAIDMPRCV